MSALALPHRELLLERQALPQPAVKVAQLSTPGGGLVTYVRMHYFASETTRALARALRQGEIDGVDGYVLDLRNNPGGALPSC
jgi:carboxyl-terminal processing protease